MPAELTSVGRRPRRRRDRKRVGPARASGRVLSGAFGRRDVRQTARSFAAQLAFFCALPGLRRVARAEGFVHGALVVRVESERLALALERAPQTILAKLPRLPDGTRIRWVRCTLGPLGELPDWLDERRAACRPRPARPEEGAVAAALLDIEDEALQAALARLYLTHCQVGAGR